MSSSPFEQVLKWTEQHMKQYLAKYPAITNDEYRQVWHHIWDHVGWGDADWRAAYEHAEQAVEDHGPECHGHCVSCNQMEYGFAKLIVKVYETTHGDTAWINPKLPVENEDAGSSSVSEDKEL